MEEKHILSKLHRLGSGFLLSGGFLAGLAVTALFCIGTPVRETPELAADPLWAKADAETGQKMYDFYSEIVPSDIQELKKKIAADCLLDTAREVYYLENIMFVTGNFSMVTPRGKVCAWNSFREILSFGEYSREGRLAGISSWWYRDHLRSISRLYPEKKIIVSRKWLWNQDRYEWNVRMTEVEIHYLAENRTVILGFNRVSGGFQERKEYIGDDPEKGRSGIQFFSIFNRGEPNCLRYERGVQKEIIRDVCKIPLDLVESGNRF